MKILSIASTSALLLGVAAHLEAATVNLNDIFSSTTTTTSFLFNDGSNSVTIGTSYETGNFIGVSATLAQFTSPAIGVGAADNNDIAITFDEPVNVTIRFSGLGVTEEFWAFDAAQSSLTLDAGHDLVTSGTGSISGYTMMVNTAANTNAEGTGTVVSWSNITSLNLRNGRRGGTSTFAQDISSFDVTVIPEPSGALFGGLGILLLLRRRRG